MQNRIAKVAVYLPCRTPALKRITSRLAFLLQTDLYSGALFIQICLGWNLYLSTLLMLAVTAVYTIAGEAKRPWAKSRALSPGWSPPGL